MDIDPKQVATVRSTAAVMRMSETDVRNENSAQHTTIDSSTELGPCPEQEGKLHKRIMRRSWGPLWKRKACTLILLLIAMTVEINAFVPLFPSDPFSLSYQARKSVPRVLSTKSPITDEAIVAVQPLKASSQERRKSAQEALDQVQRETSENKIWEILQKQRGPQDTGDPYNQLPVRPKGRPDSVPGAMNMATMMKLREMPLDQQRVANANYQKTVGTSTFNGLQPVKKRRGRPRKYSPEAAPVASPAAIASATNAVAAAATVLAPAPNVSPTASPNVDSSISNNKEESNATRLKTSLKSLQRSAKNESQVRERRRVVKMLPKSKANYRGKQEGGLTTGMVTQSDAASGAQDPPALQRYYRTELLTAEEEYSLGRKVQFMVKCEEVYEGLSIRNDSHPSIAEWAEACGFTETESIISKPGYVETPYVTQIRPSNNDNTGSVFGGSNEAISSNFFVGNGVAAANGPGRGRGRVKKPPPVKLKTFYDDSAVQFPSIIEEEEENDDKTDLWQQRLKSGRKVIINSGTADDFVELMLTAKEGKQRMVQCNMRLVVSIAKRYKHVGVNIADLVQEGSIGLTRAAEKFDPGKGFKFSTYASWWIQQAVFRSIAYHSRTIRLPVHVHNLLNRVRRTRLQLQQELGRTPSDEEVALQLGMTPEKYIKMLRLTRRAISLEKPKYQNNPKDIGQESEMLLGDTIDATTVIPDENTPEQSVDQGFFQDDLKEMLKILSEDERRVICARYGLEDGLTRTATAVAAQMRQSKSWVRSQECRALRKLRRPWYEKRLWEHQNSLTG